MGAILNGMARHGGVIPYGATFFIFSDYMRPAVRLSALMGLETLWLWTHDSIGVGEDGPTHQPVEHLPALRTIPNLMVMRPADTIETAECWQIALESQKTPSVIALTRQNLPTVRGVSDENLCKRGAYILAFMILMMVVFFAGVSPDVLKSSGHQWQKTYVEPAAGAAHPAEH